MDEAIRPSMKKNDNSDNVTPGSLPARSGWVWLLIVAALLALVIGLLRVGQLKDTGASGTSLDNEKTRSSLEFSVERELPPRRPSISAPPLTAEEIVTGKVSQFGRSRREIARGIGRRLEKEVPAEVEKFFDAIEKGQWEEIKAQWDALAKRSGQYEKSSHSEELDPFWPAVLDAYGAAEQAHLWPAQKLLDYGNAILDSLRPGMVYVGGTDNGRWIPELLNQTSGAEPHIIVTQNAFADARYLDFVNTLYQDRMTTLTSEDSQTAFQAYMTDAQKRLEHDQQFPDEAKQVRPGEDIRIVDGKVQVSGQIAVMSINERLLQTLMQKNPGLSFAIQESFPLKGTYGDALPLGPLMELGARSDQNEFTAERAAQSLQYWQTAAQQQLADPEAIHSPETLKSYSHDATAAANLLAAHNFSGEAEQAYRVATELWPENPESVSGLADLLANSGRDNEAKQLLQDFARQHPNEQKDLERISASWRLLVSPQTPTR